MVNEKENRFVVISDIHFPYEDATALGAVLKFIKSQNLQTIIMNGDILDMYDVSRFDKSPERVNSLQGELDKAIDFFSKLRKAQPNAKIVFICGNHEKRLERYLWKHSELFSLDALKIPNLLKFEKFGIEYYEKYYKLGPLKITHGSVVRKFSSYTAHAELDKNDCCGISGHTHRGGIFYKKTPSRYLAWYEGFCLCGLEPEYTEGIPDWQQGFIYGVVKGDSFAINPIPIVDGKLMTPFLV